MQHGNETVDVHYVGHDGKLKTPTVTHVRVELDQPGRDKPKARFFCGVETKANTVGDKRNCIVALTEGDEADLFLENGRVMRIFRKHGAVQSRMLSLREMAAARIDHAHRALEFALKLKDSQGRGRSEDFAYHQLLGVMMVVSKAMPEVCEGVIDILVKADKADGLRPGVERRFNEALNKTLTKKAAAEIKAQLRSSKSPKAEATTEAAPARAESAVEMPAEPVAQAPAEAALEAGAEASIPDVGETARKLAALGKVSVNGQAIH